LSRGVYQAVTLESDDQEVQYKAATLRCGLPSAVCLLSALEYYHVTDQIPKRTWILVPAEKRVISKDLKLVRSRDPQWKIGIKKTKHYWITTLQRTLVDCLIYKRLVGSQIGIEALKQAVSQGKVKLSDLYNIAKKMRVEHRVRPYIETLAA
ncbi:hypothetical protein L0244_06785, partial [bacterium]|nr:hypothetical protein [bacterium]